MFQGLGCIDTGVLSLTSIVPQLQYITWTYYSQLCNLFMLLVILFMHPQLLKSFIGCAQINDVYELLKCCQD